MCFEGELVFVRWRLPGKKLTVSAKKGALYWHVRGTRTQLAALCQDTQPALALLSFSSQRNNQTRWLDILAPSWG